MQFSPSESHDFHNFLKKFDILNRIEWTEDKIVSSVSQIVSDIKAESIEKAEIRFTIGKYMNSIRWSRKQAILFLSDMFKREAERHEIEINLILCLKYESGREEQRRITSLISDHDVADAVTGLDLVGDEAYFDVDFYAPIFREWASGGKRLIAHVGESQGIENIKKAIIDLKVDRIAHGIKIVDDTDTIKLARDHKICFEIALTSNILTGVVGPNLREHPVKQMLQEGLIITIGTDDPIICNTTLDEEYKKLQIALELSEEDVSQIKRNSFLHSF